MFCWLVFVSGYKKRLLVYSGGTCSTKCHSDYLMYFISQCVCVYLYACIHSSGTLEETKSQDDIEM